MRLQDWQQGKPPQGHSGALATCVVTRKGSVSLQVCDLGQVTHISHSQRAPWGSGFTATSVGLGIEESPRTGIGKAAYRHVVGLHVLPSP